MDGPTDDSDYRMKAMNLLRQETVLRRFEKLMPCDVSKKGCLPGE